MRRTKIVCTLGPVSLNPTTLAAMVRAGMDVARLNTSHGTLDEHLDSIKLVRSVAAAEGKQVAVLMDLSGPKLRTGRNAGGRAIFLEPGSEIAVTASAIESRAGLIGVEYPGLTEDVRAGDRVLLDDGNLELEVLSVAPDALHCRVLVGGELGEHKGVAFPNTTLTMPSLTDRDREYVKAGVAGGVDLFALSFVRDAEDILRTRELIHGLGGEVPIVAKIERRQAIENLDAILAAADGAMVARGDLGVELPPEEVPVQQKAIIAGCGRAMIPVITATQMLESMVASPRPTRAESSDVANAVWEFSDALMLSGETAIGRYPVETVAMMDRIIRRAEQQMPIDPDIHLPNGGDNHSYVVALAARRIVESDANMRAIACFTRSGYTALLLSKVHPNAPILALSPSEQVCRRLGIARSVVPIPCPVIDSSDDVFRLVDTLPVERGLVEHGDEVVVLASLPVHASGTTNFLKLHRIGESAAYA